ncbi:hypothetical protein [Streptomyces zagrosensis]|uniref:Lipoprotein n=1 Tax=Streptomyces zagrosensis TaxID=1042984 RepID=A0A7W9Q707_9ACTN|nr:hypothetical protein [Streptomyces zagrosensis]MBB5934775.1 hypothetical protein [Streptomyces zagrosensis]
MPKPRNELADLTAQQIYDTSIDVLRKAVSLRVKTSETTGTTTLRTDLTRGSGGDCVGTIDDGRGAQMRVIEVGEQLWVKPNEQYWKSRERSGTSGGAVAELFKGRYLYGHKDHKMLAPFAEWCSLSSLKTGMTSQDGPIGHLAKGEPTHIDGQLVVPIIDSGANADEKVTVYVSATGTPYPLKIVEEGGGMSGTAEMSDYGKPVSPTPPPSDQALDVAKIEKAFEKV